LGCTQEEADQASGGAAQAPRDAWFARGQDPILFWVLPCQAQGLPLAMPVSAQAKALPGAWTAAKRKQSKHPMALVLSALKREFTNSAVHSKSSHTSQ
jgi:hypothetical protein